MTHSSWTTAPLGMTPDRCLIVLVMRYRFSKSLKNTLLEASGTLSTISWSVLISISFWHSYQIIFKTVAQHDAKHMGFVNSMYASCAELTGDDIRLRVVPCWSRYTIKNSCGGCGFCHQPQLCCCCCQPPCIICLSISACSSGDRAAPSTMSIACFMMLSICSGLGRSSAVGCASITGGATSAFFMTLPCTWMIGVSSTITY